MPWGFVAAAAIGAAGSIVGGSEQAKGQEQAAQTQADMFNVIQGNEQPYMQGGAKAETALQDLLGLNGKTGFGNLGPGYLTSTFAPTQAQLNAYPGYQFALQTGGQATRNADTPGVGALSGQALKDLTNFNVGTANTYYGNYFNQFQQQQNNIFNRLSGIAGLGQNAAGNLGNNGAQLGTGIAQAQAAATGSIAGGIVGASNNIGNNSLAYLLANGGGGGTGYYDLNNSGGYTSAGYTPPDSAPAGGG